MSNTATTPEQIEDADLDAASGAGGDHKDWIPILSVPEPIRRPSSSPVAVEELSLNYEKIK